MRCTMYIIYWFVSLIFWGSGWNGRKRDGISTGNSNKETDRLERAQPSTSELRNNFSCPIHSKVLLRMYLYPKNCRLQQVCLQVFYNFSSAYKSALKPIATIFEIDLNSSCFESLLRSFRLRKPSSRLIQRGCHNAYLGFRYGARIHRNFWKPNGLPQRESRFILRKTAFLLQLALGCRVSELCGLSRNRNLTQLLENGSVPFVSRMFFVSTNFLIKEIHQQSFRHLKILIWLFTPWVHF